MQPPSAANANRFEALDGWRGLCACLVVMFHFHGYSPIYSWGLIRNSYLFVDFFFVLSGFVIAWNYAMRLDSWQGVRRFLLLRVGRVYPLHLFMLLCFLAYEVLRHLSARAQPSPFPTFEGGTAPIALLSHFFLVHSLHLHDGLTWNGPSWSISTELWTYVLFALLSVWLGVRNWMLGLVALAAPLLLVHLSRTGMDTTYDWGLIRCVFGFALGTACYQILRLWPQVQRTLPAKPGVMTMLECLMVGAVIVFVAAAGTTALSFLAPFVFAVAVLVFSVEAGWLSRLLRTPLLKWLGMLSYSIYMTHFIFVLVLPRLVKRLVRQDLWTPMPLPTGQYVMVFGRDNVEGTLLYGAVLALTVAFSAFTYRWIETPGRDWTRRWVRGAKPSGATLGQSGTNSAPVP
ncbi:MAG: acyltransferase [Ramlibacter sp.]|nr:acyltransferase [Ramlibacter sp.]